MSKKEKPAAAEKSRDSVIIRTSVVGILTNVFLAAFKAALDAEDAPRLRELLDRGRTVIESMPPTYKPIARR